MAFSGLHISVQEVPGRGRCLFAADDIAVGRVVLANAAAASVALPSERRCALCIFSSASAVCTSCKNQGSARYCGRQHQKEHWGAEHKFEDSRLKKADWDDDTTTKVLLLSRLWRGTRITGATSGASSTTKLFRNSFADALAMHKDGRPETLADCRRVAKLAIEQGFLPKEAGSQEAKAALGRDEFSLDDAVSMLSSFDSNNFMISDDLAHGRGAGVFSLGALLNHSCQPNAVISYCSEKDFMEREGEGWTGSEKDPPCGFEGQIVQVIRALRDIKKGEEICHSFVELALPLEHRQQQLSSSYDFVCTCELCTAELAAEAQAKEMEPKEALLAFPRRALESTACGLILPSPTLYKRPAPGMPSAAPTTVLTPAMVGKGESRLRAAARVLRLELCHALVVTGEHAKDRASSVRELIRMLQLLCEAEIAVYTKGVEGSSDVKIDEEAAIAVVLDTTSPLVDRVVRACSDTLPPARVRSAISEAGAVRKESASAAAKTWTELFERWRGIIPALTSVYEFPAFLSSYCKMQGKPGGGALEDPEEEASAKLEIAAIETALVVMRWKGAKRPASDADAVEEDLSCHPCHLAVMPAVNNLLPRYLLLEDQFSALAACEALAAFYNRVYRPVSMGPLDGEAKGGSGKSEDRSAIAVHPMKALHLFTAADLCSELATTMSDLYQSTLIWEKRGGAAKKIPHPFSLPLVSPQRAVRLRLMFGGLRNGEDEESLRGPSLTSRPEFTCATLPASTKLPHKGTEEQIVVTAAGLFLRDYAADLYKQCQEQVRITMGASHPFCIAAGEKWMSLKS
jgi:SET domain